MNSFISLLFTIIVVVIALKILCMALGWLFKSVFKCAVIVNAFKSTKKR